MSNKNMKLTLSSQPEAIRFAVVVRGSIFFSNNAKGAAVLVATPSGHENATRHRQMAALSCGNLLRIT